MKTRITRVILFLALIFTFFTTKTFAADCIGGLTSITVSSFASGQTVSFTDPVTSGPYSGYAGTVTSYMNGDPMPVYCIDLHRNVSLGDQSYTDTCAYVVSKLQYILNHYFPYKNGYPNELSDLNQEAASVQMAIWKYTDAVDANTITDATIKTRTLQIIADADANGTVTPPIITFSIMPGIDPDGFYVKTVDDNGVGIPINNIALSITAGTLSTYNVNTDASGISPEVTVSGTGTGIISAIARMLYSQGRIIHSTTLTRQSLTIAYPVYGMMGTTFDWGALPVELSSFTASANGNNVVLYWSTVSEVNNSGFNIERKIAGTSNWTLVGNVSGNGTSTMSHNYTFTDRNIATGNYNYRLRQIDYNGNFEYFNLNSEIEIGTPSAFELKQNYPNPFNPTTKISFALPTDGNVTLKVFDNLGREVSTLVNGFKTAGFYSLDFNGANLTSGLYFYKLDANGFSKVMKMTLVK